MTQTEPMEFDIVMRPIAYYEVCVNVHPDGRRITNTNPVDIDNDGIEDRDVPDGATIVACVPATYDVSAVYMIDDEGERTFLGYELPGIDMDWEREAREYVESCDAQGDRLCAGGIDLYE